MRMHPKPKSAPPRIKSKFMANKSNAKKEMEAWVKKDADPLGTNIEASRMSGQLVDNVTEERMLKAKLWELSKERYKFLSQTAYEKKVFIDRMQRKSSALARMVTPTDPFCGRRPSLERSDSSVFSFQSSQTGRSMNARQAFLERMDPKRSRDRPRELRCIEEGERNKKVSFPPQNMVTEMSSRPHAFTYPLRRSHDSVLEIGPKEATSKFPDVVATAASVSAVSSAMMGAIGRQPSNGVKTWAQKRPARKYGTSLQSMTADPRYSHLEHALTPMKDYQTPFDLKKLVNNMDCLHMPPKLPTETKKSKIGLKAMDLMKERGFVF